MQNNPVEKRQEVIKPYDSWWTTKFPAHAANRLATILANTDVTPNQVTVASLAFGLSAAIFMGTGKWVWMAAGALLLQASFVLDCADGQLARLKGETSQRGAWLDVTTDAIKVFAVYFGISSGAVKSTGDTSLWAWGFVAYFLSVSGMFFYYVRPAHLKAETGSADERPNVDQTAIETAYRFIRSRAYFLSYSIPDQLLLISIGAIAGFLDLLLRVLVIWGVAAVSFSVVRTWMRLDDNEPAA